MIDITRQKPLFPLRNFEDVQKLFEFNIDDNNGEPNIALLSIVAGLIEHSLVVVNDKDDLVANSRPVEHRKDAFKEKQLQALSQRTVPNSFSAQSSTNPISTKKAKDSNSNARDIQHQSVLSSTSSENNQIDSIKQSPDESDHNEAAYVSSCVSGKKSPIISPDPSDTDSDVQQFHSNDNLDIPEIEFEIVETLYKRFVDQLKSSIDMKDIEPNKVNLKIKRISDSVWEHLSNSYYKDKAHLQNIFSYLTTSKLDCFGLALAVIAGSQVLNIKDIYLALSEDHAWVMFDDGINRDKYIKSYTDHDLPVPSCALHGTCEVTWHGKANSDKRGQPVTYKNCWLYVNGYAVKCNLRDCVVALVNSMNPTINTNTDSEILALLQQRLLWMLYHRGLSRHYPMALGTLGDLETICATPGAPLKPIELFNLGIEISRNQYNDAHVYPYTYLASYLYKGGRFKETLEVWADASAVMTKYNYSRDDEEIYKEFFEVANDLIPSMLKVVSATGIEPGGVSQRPMLQDPECFALILKFYDNICVWEEGSSTPVLHTGWAKNFVATMLKFSPAIRSSLKMLTEDEWVNDNELNLGHRNEDDGVSPQQCSSTYSNELDFESKTELQQQQHQHHQRKQDISSNLAEVKQESKQDNELGASRSYSSAQARKRMKHDDNGSASDDKASIIDQSSAAKSKGTHSHEDKAHEIGSSKSSYVTHSDRSTRPGKSDSDSRTQLDILERRCIHVEGDRITLILKSSKIAGVRDLLHAERLNKTAIELQLTAQSQCAVRGRSYSSSYSAEFVPFSSLASTRSKRSHR